jgi:lactoylglutathione lyase
MYIEHVAIWTTNLELMREFYEKYLGAKAGSKYQNATKQFESYFLSFSSGARLELMSRSGISNINHEAEEQLKGYTHVSFACGSEKNVDELTDQIHKDGYLVMDGPRRTGDGYYESVILDPDGNRVEITA